MLTEDQELEKKLLLEIIPEIRGNARDEYLTRLITSAGDLGNIDLPGDKKLDIKQIHDCVRATLGVIRDLRNRFPELLTSQPETSITININKDSLIIKTKNPKIEAEIVRRLPVIIKKLGQHAPKK